MTSWVVLCTWACSAEGRCGTHQARDGERRQLAEGVLYPAFTHRQAWHAEVFAVAATTVPTAANCEGAGGRDYVQRRRPCPQRRPSALHVFLKHVCLRVPDFRSVVKVCARVCVCCEKCALLHRVRCEGNWLCFCRVVEFLRRTSWGSHCPLPADPQDAIENQLLLIVDGALGPCLRSVLSSFTSTSEAVMVQVWPC